MNRAQCGIVGACSWLGGHVGAGTVALTLLITSLAGPVRGQWTGGPTGPIYYNGGNVGIGTPSPLYKFHIRGNWASLVVDDPLGSPTLGGLWRLTSLGSGNALTLQANTAAAADFSTVVQPVTFLGNGNVGIGTAVPQYKLAVNGTIGAKDVIVTNSGWPDYVFQLGYRLRPLSEVHAYIQQHHHLPDIPTEAEVQARGVRVGEMQAKLLAKIEELTLHLIQQEQRIAQLETRAAGRAAPAARR